MSRRQVSPDESANAPVKRSRRSLRVPAARQLEVADNELADGLIDIDLQRKVCQVRQRALGSAHDDKRGDSPSLFDWGL